MAKSVKPAKKGCKSKSLKQRPAARPAHSSKAGLTAEKDSGRSSAVHEAGLTADPPSRLDDDAPRIRCRNAFQLFYANALKESTHTNSTAASAEWKKMTDEQKKPWVEGALQEKHQQLLARGIRHSQSTVPLRTAQKFARRALSLSAPSPAQSPKLDSDEVTVNAGSWKLTWVDSEKQKAIVGEGGFGCTYRGEHTRSGLLAAVKMFPATQDFRSECKHEVDIYGYIAEFDVQRRFLHIMEGGVDAPIPYIVLPWAGLSLSSYFRQQVEKAGLTAKLDPVKVVRAVVTQTADSLRFLHEKSVIHTDIKPSNLMIHGETMQVVIIDFNAAERVDAPDWQPRSSTYCTFPYRAPELWPAMHRSSLPVAGLISAAVDIWSYGVTCVETIRGGASLFAGSGSEGKAGKLIVDFAKSTTSLDKLVATLPKSVGSLSGIRQVATCALSRAPDMRSLYIAMNHLG